MTQPPTPRHPTRERRLYGAAARGYTAAMRDLFLFPLESRRELRLTVPLHRAALADLAVIPDLYGPLKSDDADGAVAADAGLIYWTMRERRPRVLLKSAARHIRKEFERRTQTSRRAEAEGYAHQAAHVYECLRQPRAERRQSVAVMLNRAAYVYVDPGPACRLILRCVRRQGAEQTRRVLAKKPQTFGALCSVRVWRFYVWPIDDTTDARQDGLPVLLRCFDAAVEARGKAGKAGPALAARARQLRMGAAAEAITKALHGPWLNFAASLVAILMRRRDVDEKRETDRPLPTIKQQLAAMLPPGAHGLIDEVIRLSEKHSGEDPVWIRGHSLEAELLRAAEREPSREMGAPSPELPAPSRDRRRGPSRDRGGLSI
jgi:hypothetical protein